MATNLIYVVLICALGPNLIYVVLICALGPNLIYKPWVIKRVIYGNRLVWRFWVERLRD